MVHFYPSYVPPPPPEAPFLLVWQHLSPAVPRQLFGTDLATWIVKGVRMARALRRERIKCPKCGRPGFDAIPGSECFCGCGAAFRISAETGLPIEVAIADGAVNWSRSRERTPRV
jgi:hypothetical protein